MDVKVSSALFIQEKTLNDIIGQQQTDANMHKKREVAANRKIMQRIIDVVIFLGKQELPFRR